ncbi:MAG: IS110 family transposase [Bacteroidota bacterium]|nr:IS110 family transposase [Bacteroidota bacterium]
MTKVKANFAEHRIDVGLDVHKRSWNAAIFLNGMYVRNIHQPPCPLALKKFLEAHYPGAHYRCAYESGKFGYWIHREFSALGIDCLVINPADIPSTHKDEIYKNDCRDARGLGQALSAGQLKSIYVPLVEQEADRNLLRHRKKLWRDLVRCKNRVKGFLDYLGVALPAQFDNANWSHNFIHWLQQLSFEHPANRMTLDYQIREVQMLRRELLNISNDIRKLMRSKKYKDLYYLLRTISGIGPLTAAALITEIGDMKRFPSFYHLNSFVGLMPMEHSSGERELKGRITVRKHRQLRSELIECAWAAKRNDPALALYYSEQVKKGKNGKAAIVKVARKLLSRIRYVWLSGKPYQTAVVQ